MGKRKNLGIVVDAKTTKAMEILNNRVQVAKQAITPATLPDGVTQDQVNMFVKAAIEMYANYQSEQSELWNDIKKVHQLPADQDTFIDLVTGELYIFE